MQYAKEQIIQFFLTDMKGAPARALYTSFRKYATLRDELVAEYSKLTGIPEDEFQDAIALEHRHEMMGV